MGLSGQSASSWPQAALHALQRLVQEARLRCTCLCHVHSQLWRTCVKYAHSIMKKTTRLWKAHWTLMLADMPQPL